MAVPSQNVEVDPRSKTTADGLSTIFLLETRKKLKD